MAWAIAHGARVISMSLGAAVQPGELFPQTYEIAGPARAPARDSDRRRRGQRKQPPPGHQARRPTRQLPLHPRGGLARQGTHGVAVLLRGGINGQGGEVNIAAPGRAMHSAAPGGGYQSMSGTSMATPHVAGVLALLAQATPNASAEDLRASLLSSAFPLTQPARDVGSGLLQAP